MTSIVLNARVSKWAALGVSAVMLLSACSLWDSTRSLWSSNPPPAVNTPQPEPVPEPVSPAPWVPPPPAPSVAPLSEPTPIEPLSDVAPQPLSTDAPMLAPAPMPTTAAPPTELAKGRYAIQVGVFLVAANAETIRTRVQEKLAADRSLKDSDKVVRSLKKGERTYVLVGDLADSHTAEFLAARLRLLLDQDVVVFQR